MTQPTATTPVPPFTRIVRNLLLRVAFWGALLWLAAHLWPLGAKIAWWVLMVATMWQLFGAVAQPRALRAAAVTPEERALAEQRIAASFPLWPFVIGLEFVGIVAVGFYVLSQLK